MILGIAFLLFVAAGGFYLMDDINTAVLNVVGGVFLAILALVNLRKR